MIQVHSAVPSSSAKKPSGHRMQSVSAAAPVVFWYVLTGQSAQSLTPLPFSFSR